jgi:hypothetical protein
MANGLMGFLATGGLGYTLGEHHYSHAIVPGIAALYGTWTAFRSLRTAMPESDA